MEAFDSIAEDERLDSLALVEDLQEGFMLVE